MCAGPVVSPACRIAATVCFEPETDFLQFRSCCWSRADSCYRQLVFLELRNMSDAKSVSDHWGTGDVFLRILDAMKAAGINPETVTIEH